MAKKTKRVQAPKSKISSKEMSQKGLTSLRRELGLTSSEVKAQSWASGMQKSKKAYTRKCKHKNRDW